MAGPFRVSLPRSRLPGWPNVALLSFACLLAFIANLYRAEPKVCNAREYGPALGRSEHGGRHQLEPCRRFLAALLSSPPLVVRCYSIFSLRLLVLRECHRSALKKAVQKTSSALERTTGGPC